jgi:hypothetical protein
LLAGGLGALLLEALASADGSCASAAAAAARGAGAEGPGAARRPAEPAPPPRVAGLLAAVDEGHARRRGAGEGGGAPAGGAGGGSQGLSLALEARMAEYKQVGPAACCGWRRGRAIATQRPRAPRRGVRRATTAHPGPGKRAPGSAIGGTRKSTVALPPSLSQEVDALTAVQLEAAVVRAREEAADAARREAESAHRERLEAARRELDAQHEARSARLRAREEEAQASGRASLRRVEPRPPVWLPGGASGSTAGRGLVGEGIEGECTTTGRLQSAPRCRCKQPGLLTLPCRWAMGRANGAPWAIASAAAQESLRRRRLEVEAAAAEARRRLASEEARIEAARAEAMRDLGERERAVVEAEDEAAERLAALQGAQGRRRGRGSACGRWLG